MINTGFGNRVRKRSATLMGHGNQSCEYVNTTNFDCENDEHNSKALIKPLKVASPAIHLEDTSNENE